MASPADVVGEASSSSPRERWTVKIKAASSMKLKTPPAEDDEDSAEAGGALLEVNHSGNFRLAPASLQDQAPAQAPAPRGILKNGARGGSGVRFSDPGTVPVHVADLGAHRSDEAELQAPANSRGDGGARASSDSEEAPAKPSQWTIKIKSTSSAKLKPPPSDDEGDGGEAGAEAGAGAGPAERPPGGLPHSGSNWTVKSIKIRSVQLEEGGAGPASPLADEAALCGHLSGNKSVRGAPAGPAPSKPASFSGDRSPSPVERAKGPPVPAKPAAAAAPPAGGPKPRSRSLTLHVAAPGSARALSPAPPAAGRPLSPRPSPAPTALSPRPRLRARPRGPPPPRRRKATHLVRRSLAAGDARPQAPSSLPIIAHAAPRPPPGIAVDGPAGAADGRRRHSDQSVPAFQPPRSPRPLNVAPP
eukprot:tig00020941_g16231.t1